MVVSRAARRSNAAALSLLVSLAMVGPAGGCRQILDLPETVECGSDDACNSPDAPCLEGQCVDGTCAYAWKAEGTIVDEIGVGDCKRNVCDLNGEVVVAVASEDASADETPGDCLAPACDAEGNVISAPNDNDVPGEDPPGDCVSPACDGGVVVSAPADDPPVDIVAGDCASPVCDEGSVSSVPNIEDAPVKDIAGDCLKPSCDEGGQLEIDDDDDPTSGCGECVNGVVVDWNQEGASCYTGVQGTENVGKCVGGTWHCENNAAVCVGEVTPTGEACGPGASGLDEDCDGLVDEDGTGCICVLGQTDACYTDDQATLNVGICHGGTATCEATVDGNKWGECVGEVIPQTCDSCVQSGDQNCDGASAPCTGSHVWSKALGNQSLDYYPDILELPNGDVMLLSTFGGTLTVGNSTVTAEGFDVALARYDSAGNGFNVKGFGGAGGEVSTTLVGLDDGYLISGRLGSGSSEAFGAGATLTAVGSDGFLAKFNLNHTLAWKKLIGGTLNDELADVVRMPDNGVAVSGRFEGTINLGGQNLVSAGGDDMFVARFDSLGNHLWSKRFGDSNDNSGGSLAAAPNGDLIMAGALSTNLSFGGTTINVAGGSDGYVVRFDPNGAHLWTRAIQSTSDEFAAAAGVLSDGSVWVAGAFEAAVNVDGQPGTDISPTSTGYDLLLVKYSASGAFIDSAKFNCTDAALTKSMNVGVDDAVVIAGSYRGTLYFTGAATPAVGGDDAFLFKINPSGDLQWSKKFGSSGGELFWGADQSSCGDVFAVATFGNSVNFGGGSLTAAGNTDVALIKYRQ
ncbi:MAG: hypothetical protein HOW73_19795 [Polyangiaceae bacterium]|nr:hypothetical protein [Polyangiaceae bacterium]